MADLGYFGPDSVSWQVHREVTVLFGGARAVLMQAAHPLVIAGARETGFYERNPWKRLQRTLVLTYTITFGTKAEADAAAERINDVHARVKGVDDVTGLPYDALDPDLLLYVHACLVESALLFERLTVGELDEAGRQRFHEEQMLAAEMVGIPRAAIPPTVPELRAYLQGVYDSGLLRVGEAAQRVAALFHDPPREAEWRPVLVGVSQLAFGTLPRELRRLYGVEVGSGRRAAMRAAFAATRTLRPLLPPRFRFIAPYQEWRTGSSGRVRDARRSAGVRVDGARSLRGETPAPTARLRAWTRSTASCSTSTASSPCRGSRCRARSRRRLVAFERRPVPADHQHDDQDARRPRDHASRRGVRRPRRGARHRRWRPRRSTCGPTIRTRGASCSPTATRARTSRASSSRTSTTPTSSCSAARPTTSPTRR